jgi:hypothetical protein
VTVKHPSFGKETFDIALRQSLSAVIALAAWTKDVAGVAALTAPPSNDGAEFVALTALDWPVDDAGSSADEGVGSPVEPLEQAAAMRTGAKNSNDERRMEGMSLLLVVGMADETSASRSRGWGPSSPRDRQEHLASQRHGTPVKRETRRDRRSPGLRPPPERNTL